MKSKKKIYLVYYTQIKVILLIIGIVIFLKHFSNNYNKLQHEMHFIFRTLLIY